MSRPPSSSSTRGQVCKDQFQIVRGDNLRAGQAVKQADELAPAARVKIQRRLVQQQYAAAASPGRRPTPRAASRRRTGGTAAVPPAPSAPTAVSASATAAPHLVRRQTEIERTKRHVVEDRRVEELVVAVLEDNADMGRQLAALARSRKSSPPTRSVRACGTITPLRHRNKLVLPAPLGPIRPTLSPTAPQT